MLNRKYQCNGFMTNWANWGCGKGRVGQGQTSRTAEVKDGAEGGGGGGDYKYFRSIGSVQ